MLCRGECICCVEGSVYTLCRGECVRCVNKCGYSLSLLHSLIYYYIGRKPGTTFSLSVWFIQVTWSRKAGTILLLHVIQSSKSGQCGLKRCKFL